MTKSLKPLNLAKFAQLVNDVFKNYGSVLALARSPLANSELITPLLVLDDVSPTANERGTALRLLISWATERLAPDTIPYPIGENRPFDDPTWRSPSWWRYNILRHRYLEPLHPDDFVEGGRFTETLISLTGIPSPDTLFDERNRAIREVAQWLQQQYQYGQATEELRQLSLERICLPLTTRSSETKLIEIASIFEGVFPRLLLLKMAVNENVSTPEAALNFLISQRFLLTEDEGATLLLSSILQRHISIRQTKRQLRSRHRQAGEWFASTHDPLIAADHFFHAQEWDNAATIIMQRAMGTVDVLDLEDICVLMRKFTSEHLSERMWCDLQVMLSDLLVKIGQHEKALEACRSALTSTHLSSERARIYRRMGKLYEKHNQLHALGYYEQAFDEFTREDNELFDLLKDRAWLNILRQDWDNAEADLRLALEQEQRMTEEQQADVYDALATLYRHQRMFEPALRFARKSLHLREVTGNLGRIASSFGNLGLLYTDIGEYEHAIVAYSEAMSTFQILGRQDENATTLLNVGTARHLNDQIENAIENYQQSVKLCQQIDLPLVEVRGHYNLAEAYAEINRADNAKRHWLLAYQLSEKCGFDDELADLLKLQAETTLLQIELDDASNLDRESTPQSISLLEPEEQSILKLTKDQGRITAKLLMETTHVSKATANRRLVSLLKKGHLQKYGKGRGTYYALPPTEQRNGFSPDTSEIVAPSITVTNWPQIHTRLQEEKPKLQQEFSVAQLGLIQTHHQETSPFRVLVRFQTDPDLTRFFELEQHLINSLDADIDLILADSTRHQQIVLKAANVHWFD